MIDLQNIPSWFLRDTTEGQALVQRHEQQHVKTRVAWAEQLASIRAEREKSIVTENKIIDAAEVELQKRQDAANRQFAKVRQLKVDRHNAQFRFDRAVQDIERQLRMTADEAIDAFIRELNDEGNELCRDSSIRSETQAREKAFGMIRVETIATNLHSIRRRLEAMGDAVAQAEALKLSPTKDIAAELQALRDNLPPVQLEPVKA